MSARYKGTCIGGVADGHWIERDDPNIRIETRKKKPMPVDYLSNDADRGEVILAATEYKFLLLLGNGNTEIGVWAPQDITIEQVVMRLVNCYNPRTGLIGEPVANAMPIRRQ